MESFGIIMFKGQDRKPWMDEQPFRSVEALVDWIYSMQIDNPNTIKAILWLDEVGTWSDITAKVAELVWEIYDTGNEHCHRETVEWFKSFELPSDHMCV